MNATERVTSFKIGDGENDIVLTEDLLMKLALAENVMLSLADYADRIGANDGIQGEYNEPPDSWAVTGMFQNIKEVSNALKAGCWGYEVASMR